MLMKLSQGLHINFKIEHFLLICLRKKTHLLVFFSFLSNTAQKVLFRKQEVNMSQGIEGIRHFRKCLGN